MSASVVRQLEVGAPPAAIWPVLSDLRRYQELMPLLESHRALETPADAWEWVIAPQSALGQRVQPRFRVRYELDAPVAVRMSYVPAGANDTANASGAFTLDGGGERTQLTVRLSIELDLAIPSLLAGSARRLIEQRVSAMAGGFADNVAREAQGRR